MFSLVEAFHKDLGMIFSFSMLVNFYATLIMLSSCYAKHLSYLFYIMFLSLNIL
jgi:hypothetical protein